MSPIRILQVSDFHYARNGRDQRYVVSGLLEDVAEQHSKCPIDLIIFTADLVYSGVNGDDFIEPYENVIKPLLTITGNTTSRLVIIPGNHDVDADCIREKLHLRTLENNFHREIPDSDAFNTFIERTCSNPEYGSPFFEKLANYFQLERRLYGDGNTRSNPFFTTRRVEVRGIMIGIAGFNTAWRSQGQGEARDKGKLLLGERAVDIASEDLKDCALRLALYHHPLDYLVDHDIRRVKPRLQEHFHIQCYGHRHEVHTATENTIVGASILIQSGCLYQNRDYPNGYQLLDMDMADGRLRLHSRRYYDHPRRKFGPDGSLGEAPFVDLPLKLSRGSPDDEWRRLQGKIEAYVRDKGNEHLALMTALDEQKFDLERHVVEPPLTRVAYPEAFIQGSGENSVEPPVTDECSVKEMLLGTGDFYVIGPPQSGKTILAYTSLWHCSRGVADVPRLPIYVPFSSLRQQEGLEKHLLNALYRDFEYLSDIRTVAPSQRLYVVDDVDADDVGRCEILARLRNDNPGARFILFRKSRNFFFDWTSILPTLSDDPFDGPNRGLASKEH